MQPHRIASMGPANDVRNSCPGSQHSPLRVTQINRLVAQFNQQYTLFLSREQKRLEALMEI